MAKSTTKEEIAENMDEVGQALVSPTDIDLKSISLEERILLIMNEIRLVKNGKNTYSNYEYFKPEEINQKINPLLLKYKIFPHFYTTYEKIASEEQQINNSEGSQFTFVTKNDLKEVAILELSDILKPEKSRIYKMYIDKVEIKGANKMQNIRRHPHVCKEIFIHGSF